jgi:hypothetical protein
MRVGVRPSRDALRPKDYVFEMTGGCNVEIRWKDNAHLTIAYPRGAEISTGPLGAPDIEMEYVGEAMPNDPRSC